jgi:hypothetical protein
MYDDYYDDDDDGDDDDDDGTFVYFYRFLVPYVISHYFQYSFQTLLVLKEERCVRDMYMHLFMTRKWGRIRISFSF